MDNLSQIKFRWTPSDDALLRELAAQRQTAAQIAMVFGVTRNSIIGRCHREHIKLLGQSGKHLNPKPVKSIRLTTVTVPKPAPLPIAKPVTVRPDECKQGVAFFDLGPRSCRYALGGPEEPARAFCGEQTPAGSAWCAVHRAIVYLPKPPKNAQPRPFAFNRPVVRVAAE